MADESKYDPNQAGSGSAPKSSDSAVRDDAQTAVDRAERASELHRAANKLADHSRR
jgi:hypothetical protein